MNNLAKENIFIKGAYQHNLKNIDVCIPRHKLIVITGLSGSGKSSLAFHTLYAEGQRRYIESLSAYARQFMGKINKPKVKYIKGISPAIAVEQKVNTTNPRSTVGTTTEIYDYLKLLFARVGSIYSPISGDKVQKHTVNHVIDFLKTQELSNKILLMVPIIQQQEALDHHLNTLWQQGYTRVKMGDKIYRINNLIERKVPIQEPKYLVIDRWVLYHTDEFYNQIADSIETAFYEGKGQCIIQNTSTQLQCVFSNRLELDGITFVEPSVHLFDFNNPLGACPKCQGYGNVLGIDEKLVIPDTGLSVYQGAVMPWKGDKAANWKEKFISQAHEADFPIHKPYYKLDDKHKKFLWNSTYGIYNFFKKVEEKIYKIQNRVLLSRYRGKSQCPQCNGQRLCKEASYVRVGGYTLKDLVQKPLDELLTLIQNLQLTPYQKEVSKRLLTEIETRLEFVIKVGLGYLTLNRNSNTLSGGESQRINLATSLSSNLTGSMYILDEPSIGLHSLDTQKLIEVLKSLCDLGNTVIVVEHDEDVIKAADVVIDIGPQAGVKGGEVVFQGNYADMQNVNTLTAQYLRGTLKIETPKTIRPFKNFITLKGVRQNNLKNIDVRFPLNNLIVVTGVSGSGKSSLIDKVLHPALKKHIDEIGIEQGQYDALEGNLSAIKCVEFVNQNPIGKSSRSNPITYIGAYDDIRQLFANTPIAKKRKLLPKHFSFNVDAGRCENCKGEGKITVQMQFMSDVHLPCELCKGTRFKQNVLDVKFKGKNIAEILQMTIYQASAFFTVHAQEKIVKKIEPLKQVGMGYVKLGQASSTLSGGEAQRVKLASFLDAKKVGEHTFFIFDEPTTGLHIHDIKKLLISFDKLLEQGHTICVIEHHLDVIKCADWVIDLGPSSGNNGGNLLFEGTCKEFIDIPHSPTATFLKEKY